MKSEILAIDTEERKKLYDKERLEIIEKIRDIENQFTILIPDVISVAPDWFISCQQLRGYIHLLVKEIEK